MNKITWEIGIRYQGGMQEKTDGFTEHNLGCHKCLLLISAPTARTLPFHEFWP